MPHPRILLYGHGGYGNHGCEAIVRSTAALLLELNPEAELVVASERSVTDRIVPVPGIAKYIQHGVSTYSPDRFINSITSRLGAPREMQVARTQSPVIRMARRSDACLSVGGDTYCYGRPEKLNAINRRLRGRKIPLLLWGCSVEASCLQGDAREDLALYDALYARESFSLSLLSDQGLPARQGADPAFTLDMQAVALPEGFIPGNTVGINLSPLSLKNAVDPDALSAGIRAIIDELLASTDAAVALIPHVRWAHDDDLEALGALKAAYANEGRVLLLDRPMNAPQLKYVIARLKALVTARTHASIAAYSAHVPTLVLGYSIKARGLAYDLFGREEGYVLPVQAISHAGQLPRAFDDLLRRAAQDRAQLQKSVPVQVARAGQMAKEVMALAEAHA